MKIVSYQEAFDYLVAKEGWKSESVMRLGGVGRMAVISHYLEGISEEDDKTLQFGSIVTESGEEIDGMPYHGNHDESFEDVVRREYEEFGYSQTLDISIEDCADESLIIDDREEVLKYLMELQRKIEEYSHKGADGTHICTIHFHEDGSSSISFPD